MGMNRNEYEALAGAIHDVEDVPEPMKERITLEIVHALAATNPTFDPMRFVEQTGLNLTREDLSAYSRALFLRVGTGVGATREHIRRERTGA